ncbi:hypothetical protein [Paenibacillus larvae]|uniref:Uncharacterized protein n=1 Tax=Paenibacillus larvae TaxID=1464 RepID=A0AAP5N1M7_9BACL|nr:hypothetical protein [Paenibacillus larvae]MDR5598111.1 hypothetical protein [Paenibacillus larvae]MDT2230862.1 hypothetical protein [Paenibacillus larvae]MDT2250410.1 hypothetical protein [Paenibacillus larvae]MDT2270432.1 hypothetical protein [Paenibacillus larvae]MDT2280162.1 hypothetical protein [Paenibacillus larvae]
MNIETIEAFVFVNHYGSFNKVPIRCTISVRVLCRTRDSDWTM